MLSIFAGMVEDFMELLIYDFSVVGDTFDDCLIHLGKGLQKCVNSNLVLN